MDENISIIERQSKSLLTNIIWNSTAPHKFAYYFQIHNICKVSSLSTFSFNKFLFPLRFELCHPFFCSFQSFTIYHYQLQKWSKIPILTIKSGKYIYIAEFLNNSNFQRCKHFITTFHEQKLHKLPKNRCSVALPHQFLEEWW